MSSAEDEGSDYDVPPPARSSLLAGALRQQPTNTHGDAIPPVQASKRNSDFYKTVPLVDRKAVIITPVPAPRRLSSTSKLSSDFVEFHSEEATDDKIPNLRTAAQGMFSKSLDLPKTRNSTDDVFSMSLSEQPEATVSKSSSTKHQSAISLQSWPPPRAMSSDGLSTTEFEGSLSPTAELIYNTTTQVPMNRPIPKPRTRIKLPPPQSVDLLFSLSSQPDQNYLLEQLHTRHSQALHSKSSENAHGQQLNCPNPTQADCDSVEAALNDEDRMYRALTAQNKTNISPEVLHENNHQDLIRDNSQEENDENYDYIHSDNVIIGLSSCLPQSCESEMKIPASPTSHPLTQTPSYVQMGDKREMQTSASSPSLFSSPARKHSQAPSTEQMIDLESEAFSESSSDNIILSEDSEKDLYIIATTGSSSQRQFNNVQSSTAKIPLTSNTFPSHSFESGVEVPASSKPNSLAYTPSYVEMGEKRQAQTSASSPSLFSSPALKHSQDPGSSSPALTDPQVPSSFSPALKHSQVPTSSPPVLTHPQVPSAFSPARKHSQVPSSSSPEKKHPQVPRTFSPARKNSQMPSTEQVIDLRSEAFSGSTTDNKIFSDDSNKESHNNTTTGCTAQRPFNDIQPFTSKVFLPSRTFDEVEKKETNYHQTWNNSEIDLLWNGVSKPGHSPSKPVAPSLSRADSDFAVDWDSAFAKPVSENNSSIHSSGTSVTAEKTKKSSGASYSQSAQKSAVSTAPLIPQYHDQTFLHEAPTSLPPPLPLHQNNFSDTDPPPLPKRSNNSANMYSHTVLQSSPIKKTTVDKSSPNKDIFGDLPTPAFSQNQNIDPFQDSNFDFECYQFNKTQVHLPPPVNKTQVHFPSSVNKTQVHFPPSVSTSPETPTTKPRAASQDIITADATDTAHNVDPEHMNDYMIPPNSKELHNNDCENIDFGVQDTYLQEHIGGVKGTRLKVFDSSLLPKKNARCGYLFKQGGYKANKGWKKRWVVYNGAYLSYFSNNTSQVSKRIIPVRCMIDIETDVKATDKNSFRFKVVTSLKDRVFVFSSETLDDCLTWANTLMAAITEYRKSVKVDEQPSVRPDIEGFIKFGNIKRYYVTITGKLLCYYQSYEDYQMGSPTHEIDMKLASVKVKDHKKLQLWVYYGHFNLTFESDQEMQQWRLAMEDAIAEGLADDTVLKKVYENMSNQHCADCGVENPHWASVNLGIVICKNCAGIHRMFDYRLSKIRSLRMDTRVWTPSLVELMVTIGNANANAFWEFELPAGAKIQPTEPTDRRKEFIFKKYKSRKFCKLHPLANQGPVLGEELVNAARHDNVLEMIKVLFSGADVLYRKEEHGSTAYDIAKEYGQRLIMELLYQNGGDPQTSEQDITDENRLREDVRLQGYLNKTGPVGRSFEKRWCILEHGAMTYYLNEKSKTFKGSIHRRDMHLIQTVESDRVGYPFELSTGLKDNRIFTFSSDSKDDCGEWIRTIGKLMAPVAVMDQVGMIDVKLAGYAFMKESLVDEWRQTFLVFSWRGIYYMNTDLKFDHLDLRKASGIKMQDSSNSYQQRGPCFVISSTGKSVYLQATLARDTEKMYTAFLDAVLSSGSTLIDQALTNENVPVIVEKCITHIYMNGLDEKGIYRVAGQNSRVHALLDEFRKDVWSVCMSSYTVQDVSNALKRFLRELDDSVFGRINYTYWINMAGCRDVNNRLMWYKYYLEKMPQVNFQTLKRIVLHLVQVSQHEKTNLMSINNLASCFAPSLMRTAKDDQPILASDSASKEINIMVDLLNNADYFFHVNDNERIILNNIKRAEKEIQKKILENRNSMVDPAAAGILIPVHVLCREGQSVNILVTEEKTAKEAMEYLKRNKTAPDLEIYVLHEQLFRGALERPLFPEDIIARTTNRWMEWESWVMEGNNVCLCVRGIDLLEKLNTHFSPNHALLSKHQYRDSKPNSRFKRRVIGFRQCKLALYTDSQGSSELISWKVEDLTIYLGSVPRKTLPPYRYCLTFTVNGEKYTKQPFGHCISFETENELCRWAAALYAAQHPAGLLSWATE